MYLKVNGNKKYALQGKYEKDKTLNYFNNFFKRGEETFTVTFTKQDSEQNKK
jgi:hypothetical protein